MTTLATASPSFALSRLDLREAIAWTAAAAVVICAHLAIAYAAQYLSPPEAAGGDAPPALVIELAPMLSTPAIAVPTAATDEVLPETAEPVDEQEMVATAEPDQVVERLEDTSVEERVEPVVDAAVEPPADKPPEIVEPDQRIEAEPVETQPVEAQPVETPQEPLDEVIPDVMEAVAAEVVIPLPESRPVEKAAEVEQTVEKAAPKAAKKVVEKGARKKEATEQSSKSAPSASADAKPARAGAAGVSKSRVSPAKWQSKVLSWLNRHKRYPGAAKSRGEEGNVKVSFTIDALGRVKSSRIARSSGNAELDRAALEMVQRSSPVPAPPPEIARPSMSIVVPVVFSLK